MRKNKEKYMHRSVLVLMQQMKSLIWYEKLGWRNHKLLQKFTFNFYIFAFCRIQLLMTGW